ncbi:MAG: HAD hydrolase family protein [Deltaproteobacteria bacterium]|nr:HAD hydrolase family protein [Deltaproteobacteria bacterium]MBW2016487.1 HAD hydrolase family protein [Deltaproteobacteria bacterium]MBW2128491.1 HAD hydrolase family protein [Deltaproteobacteria bacterium]MBW2303650.1 HAD hydrolase family protein [Deltaproteobacteria bacterium]
MVSTETAIEKARQVKFVILDIHGVLTDNTLYYTDDGKKSECFSLADRLGCISLMEGGIGVAFLTSKISRADQQVGEIYTVPPDRLWGTSAKIGKLDEFEKETGLQDQDFCYVGDEMIDLGIMKRVGFPVAPADGAIEARNVAAYITKAPGGRGVVREIAEFILKAQGKWDTVIQKISQHG